MDCPKCGNSLVERTRSNVAVDVCTGCQGIWLDRGELDKLLDQEDGRDNGRRDDDDRGNDDDDGPGGMLRSLLDLFGR